MNELEQMTHTMTVTNDDVKNYLNIDDDFTDYIKSSIEAIKLYCRKELPINEDIKNVILLLIEQFYTKNCGLGDYSIPWDTLLWSKEVKEILINYRNYD